MTAESIMEFSATAVIEELGSGKLLFSDVDQAQRAFISRRNETINAFDKVFAQPIGSGEGPLAGLPISVKDQISIRSTVKNFGLDSSGRKPCEETASVVQTLIDLGARVTAKTTLPPYALDLQTFNRRCGRTNHPDNSEYTTGGSSGGGAAAVASNMSFVDIGADLCGSIRLPAAFCGINALLPGEGVLLNDGFFARPGTIAHFARPGIFARSVDDLTVIWNALRPADTMAKPHSDRAPKIGIWSGRSDIPVTQSIRAAFQGLSNAGVTDCELVQTDMSAVFTPAARQAAGQIIGYETGACVPWLVRRIAVALGKKSAMRSPHFLNFVHEGYRRNEQQYAQALKRRLEVQQKFEQTMNDLDAILVPVASVNVFKHRSPDSERSGIRDYVDPFVVESKEIGYLDALTGFASPVTLVGNPVVVVSIGKDSNGMPIGAQLIGRHGQEQALLESARIFTDSLTLTSHDAAA